MMNLFKKVLDDAIVKQNYEIENLKILVDDELVDATKITVHTSETGDCVVAVFHDGTGSLIDLYCVHKCTCGHCKHS